MKWLNTWDNNSFQLPKRGILFNLSSAIWQEPKTCKNRNRTYSSWKVKRNKWLQNKYLYTIVANTIFKEIIFTSHFYPHIIILTWLCSPDQYLLFCSHVPWSWVVVLLRCIPWPLWCSFCVPVCCHLPLASFLWKVSHKHVIISSYFVRCHGNFKATC